MKVICINAKNRPTDFPKELWLAEQVEIYTVKRVLRMPLQNTFAFDLKERDLSGLKNYDGYDFRRFRPATEEDEKELAEAQRLMEELLTEELVLL